MQDKIRVLIKARNLTLSRLSNESGVNISRISQYLARKSDLRGDSLCKVLNLLGVDLDTILSKKINQALDNRTEESDVYENLQVVLESLPRLDRKTILETIISKAELHGIDKGNDSVERLKVLKNNISTIL